MSLNKKKVKRKQKGEKELTINHQEVQEAIAK
jgi:hypothetical protein